GLNNSPDLSQDVPATNYNTETGFLSSAFNSTTTGIALAGKADQGTRLALTLQNVPQGSSVFVPSILYLHAQSDTADPSVSSTNATGVMVLVTTDANGAGAYTRVSSGSSPVLEPA